MGSLANLDPTRLTTESCWSFFLEGKPTKNTVWWFIHRWCTLPEPFFLPRYTPPYFALQRQKGTTRTSLYGKSVLQPLNPNPSFPVATLPVPWETYPWRLWRSCLRNIRIGRPGKDVEEEHNKVNLESGEMLKIGDRSSWSVLEIYAEGFWTLPIQNAILFMVQKSGNHHPGMYRPCK